jgi:hypothetical protein
MLLSCLLLLALLLLQTLMPLRRGPGLCKKCRLDIALPVAVLFLVLSMPHHK